MKKILLKAFMLLCLIAWGGVSSAWADTYVQLTSIANIDENAEYVLGIDGTGFHKSGTSSWGVCTNSGGGTPLTYKLKKAADGKSFKASTEISGTTYYLTVPTSNTFTMATSSTADNTDMIIGTTQVSGTNYAVTNKETTTRHLRLNGTSGLRSYAGTTGTMAFFYKVVADGPTVSSISIKTAPTKTTYMAGETFDPTGLVITKTLSNATTADVTYNNDTKGDFTFDPALETELTDETSVTITYGKKTATQTITVNPFVATAGTYTINTNNGLYGVSTGNNGTEQSTTKFGITIVSGCKSSASSKTYYDTDHIRYYTDSYLKLTAPTGFEITKVVFTANGTWNSGPKCGSNGTYNNSTKTWEGTTSQLDLTFSDQNRIKSINVTYAVASGLKTSTLTLSPATITVENGQTAEGTYTLSDDEYDGELSVEVADEDIAEAIIDNGAIVVKGKAVGTTTLTISGPATATYNAVAAKTITINVTAPLPSGISAIRDAITSTDSKNPSAFTVRLTDAVVTYVNGSNTYIEDENNALLIYKSSLGLTAGQKINGVVSGTGYVYNGLKEANAFTYSQATVTNDGVIPCTTVTVAEIADDIEAYESRRVKVEGLTITVGMNSRNATATQGSDEILIREQTSGNTASLLAEGAYVYDMIAFPARYNEDIQLGVWKKSDITMGATVNLVATDGDYYYATYSGASTFKVPSDLVVEEIGINNDGTLNRKAYETGAYVPANTGVLVYSDEPGVHGFALSENKGTSVLKEDNCLRPTGSGINAAAMAAADADSEFFRLTMHNGTQIGFWWGAENGAAFDLGANKAYLAVATDNLAGARNGFWFGDNEEALEAVEMNDATTIYTLEGVKVNELQKGLNIVNGKKVMVK